VKAPAVKSSQIIDGRQDKNSRLRDCSFQLKTVEPIIDEEASRASTGRIAIMKIMVSTCTVSFASKRDAKKIQAMIGNMERPTHRFFIIPKEVKQLKYCMRINGKFCSNYSISILHYHLTKLIEFLMYKVICVACYVDALRKDDWDAAQVEIMRLQT